MKRATFVPYKAMDGYRWRLMGGNGETIADGGQSYTRLSDCLRAIRNVRLSAAVAKVR